MLDARPKRTVVALALALVAALWAGHGARAGAPDGGVAAGTVISNRAEATYTDPSGMGFATVSPTVSVTVVVVAGLIVTPDETEPSATVSPRDRVARLFRVCNTGNTPDFYTLTAAEASAPAALVSLHYDLDGSGTLTEGDRPVTVNQTMSPRLARGACVGVVATLETNDGQQGQQFTVRITARSNVLDAVGGGARETGTVVNVYGRGARLTSPDDPELPPVKLVEGHDRVTASTGQTLGFLISFRNSGDVEARQVVLRDELPEGLDYVAGTLRLEGQPLTDAEDADQGLARDRRLEVRFARVAPGELARVSFQARVASAMAPGTGLVNTALATADNAPAASSTNATAVVNPFGLVYQGRSAGTPIAGARVALVGDQTGGALVPLTSDGGTAPNDANANPFVSDGQGRWSFVLSPAQLGSAGAPARYFLNVTAPGYRARLIEVSIKPGADTTGLFALTVRALDGQPVAQAGGFELSEEAVEIARLAAFALNVPMFENTALELTKSADRPSAEIGDVVTYRVEVHNATPVTVEDLTVRDQLPPSFHYAAGTARFEAPPAPARNVEPEVGQAEALTFRLGRLAGGARATLLYRVRVGANAREGEQFNSAQGSGTLSTGEAVGTATARASVRVRRGVFSSQQVILGRVFEDANGNGLFDRDERGLPDVRIYLNNGQSVMTDSAGLYNFPVVNEGVQVLSLDPVTLPYGYALADTGRRDERSWTRLLRTPLGGGALLRQNFALRAAAGASSSASAPAAPGGLAPQTNSEKPQLSGSLFGGELAANNAAPAPSPNGAAPKPAEPGTAGTYELVTNETLAPVAPGAVRVVSPRPEETVLGASLEISAQVNGAWTVAVEVEGRRVPDSKIGERRLDRKNDIATFVFVGVNVAPGPNRIRVTPIGPAGQEGLPVELVAYGRGPAKRLEILTDKPELAAGGRDRTTVRVRAFDQWNRPAADGSVSLEVSEGRLLRVEGESAPAQEQDGKAEDRNPEVGRQDTTQQTVPLVGGEGRAVFVAGSAPGQTEIRATTGTVEAKRPVRVTPEVRSGILVGLAEVTVGASGPELSAESDALVRSRLAFFYRGQFLGSNLLTLAYDSNRPVNRTGGHDRLFQLDPLDRVYPLFGDSSTRSEDAQSNSKLYLRVDRGRSYFLFGDFETDNKEVGLASYTRRLTGAKLHIENARGDYVSVTGARPDTAFARDVFPGGVGGFARLSHAEILPGSESVVIEVRDRRNPEVILSREALIRSVDYNLDASTGEIFFLRPVSTFDFSFNLVQTVVTYEYRAEGMSSAVYTARAFKTFEDIGLRVGLSYVDQRQGEFGTFRIGGLDAEKTLPRGGRLRAELAASRGRAAVSGNLFSSADGDDRHDGQALRLQLEQPLPWRDAVVRAGFLRAGEGFLNPFGETVTPGSQRAEASVELKARASSRVRLSFVDERNRTENVDNSRQTASLLWTEQFGERLRATFGYDFRRFRDQLEEGRGTDSNLVTVGAEWQATDKLQLSAKREQNLSGEADPTYPDQTTLAATYQWNKYTRLFFTQRFSSAPITPIADPTGGGFFSTGARRETAVGVETKLGRVGNLVSRYQLENGINGTDSFAVVGLSNRLALNKQLGLDFGFERGFHLDGEGESFNSGHLGFTWQPAEGFRTTARYEMRDRGGMGSILTLGAQGRLLDNLTSLARFQLSRTSFDGRAGSALSMTAAVAWRPLESDRAGLLFSYTRRDLAQAGAAGAGDMRDRSDTLSSDWYYQATRRLELYGRFALRFGDNQTPELARVATFTYMTQGRAIYRLSRSFDVAGEGRWLAQPSTATHRASFGAELGYWVLADLRLGGGYNWVRVGEPFGAQLSPGRRGFYFTISSKLSNLFDLFGTPKNNAQPGEGGDAQPEAKKEE
ncbi:MAG TPA: hypothetical protein VG148_15115 [Pyrinomonadaceae bacterium]|nr:hypothetical protein [Pyrinomonadaceae bacterium]